jgi:hypothetical protein
MLGVRLDDSTNKTVMTTKRLIKGQSYVSYNALSRLLTFVGKDELVRNRYWFTCPDYADAENPKGSVYVSQHAINREFRPA